MTVGLLALSRLDVDTPFWQVAIFEYLFGAGLGFTMQTIVTAVQNSVDRRDMGSATSSITFFRQMGGSIGAALFGAVLSSRLAHYLAEQLARAGISPGAGGPRWTPTTSRPSSSSPSRSGAWSCGFTNALDDVFLVGVPFVAVAIVVALLLKEEPLRTGQP